MFHLHLQDVGQGQRVAAGIQTTAVVPRILCGQGAELQGGARLCEAAVVFEPGDLQVVESAECSAVESDAVASSERSLTSGAVYRHCGV